MSSALTFDYSIPLSEGSISSCEWSPSARLLAICSSYGFIEILDATGSTVSKVPIPENAAQSISWSPHELFLAVATSSGRVLLVDLTDRAHSEYDAHNGSVYSVAFSPNGDEIASGGEDGKLTVFSPRSGHKLSFKFADEITAITWLNTRSVLVCCNDGGFSIITWNQDHHLVDSRAVTLAASAISVSLASTKTLVAIGSKTGSIFLITPDLHRTIELEGHTSSVQFVGFAAQDRVLVSKSDDGTIKLWDPEAGSELETLKIAPSHYSVAVHNKSNLIAILNDTQRALEVWNIDPGNLLATVGSTKVSQYCSAKVALVGESNVGKSCLALRLAEDRYQEIGTTHGMRFWSVQPTQLDSKLITPENQKREIILWDMGGQDEYRLIHQLFLHDTTVALILLDPTRGRTAFDEAEGWSKRFDKQIGGRTASKLLVATKMDSEEALVDRRGLERLIIDQNFQGLHLTSAQTGRGVTGLGAALSRAIDWDSLTLTTRPQLFQTVRVEIDNARKRGEAVLLLGELEDRVQSIEKSGFDPAAVAKVISQLALQGLIATTRLTSGQDALVLNIEHIERYAGSLIMVARNNRRGVPAIEETSLMADDMIFPGISSSYRLPRRQELVVLECIIQLLIEHGICIEHEGLLVFPSLFTTEPDSSAEIRDAISLYYDFSGAIDNIYSSLICAVTVSEQFGAVRLWDNRAEFTKAGQGTCGLRKIARPRGFAHLDVYFSDETDDSVRELFVSVVEQHLARHGVDIYEHVDVTCTCGHQFSEAVIRQRISDGNSEIGCPVCDLRVRITQGAKEVRQRDPEIVKTTWALRSQIRTATHNALNRAKRNIARPDHASDQPIRILHLSDLHVSKMTNPDELLGPLCLDLRSRNGGLEIEKLDYLVLSGDISDTGQQLEYEIARRLVSGIISEFGLNAERCIVVPGNHDIDWEVDVYDWTPKRRVTQDIIDTGICLKQGNGFLVRNDAYNERLKTFSDNFYHTLVQRSYPLKPEEQTLDFYFPRDNMQFVCLNTCWEIDEHFQDRASVNKSAIAEGLRRADSMIRRDAQRVDDIFRIAVLHHPVSGNEKVKDDAFLGQLRQAGVKIILHGHIHESRADLVGYFEPARQLHIIGAGSFGASMKARPESTPRLYNIIELSRNFDYATVHTRSLRKDGAAWEPWAVWPSTPWMERRSYYRIGFLEE
jgi:predicted MPP superfamily phosphohydrolase